MEASLGVLILFVDPLLIIRQPHTKHTERGSVVFRKVTCQINRIYDPLIEPA